MALLYRATLTPTKIELLQVWVPTQPWSDLAEGSALDAVGAYRFDDPEGEVGVETHLLKGADGRILQVPVTYRGEPLPAAESFLVGTTDHSVLGTRWVYDACGDPVYVRALATAILQGGTQADLEVMTDNGPRPWQATTHVAGSGTPGSPVPSVGAVTFTTEGSTTVIRTEGFTLTLSRVIDSSGDSVAPGSPLVLTGTWPGHETPAALARLQLP
jgi:hypothetical protein